MLIIGSQALKLVAPDLLDRTPADWDLIATPDEAETWAKQSGGNAYPDGRGKKQVVRGL